MSYHAERKLLQIQNGKLHYQIWRLGREKETEDQVSRLKTELEENAVRIRTLDYLIKNDPDYLIKNDKAENSQLQIE